MHDKLLTVLIPNFGYARYIPKTIDSIASQDYGPVELLIVDDCSKDNSIDVIKKKFSSDRKLQRKKLLTLKKNLGKLGAINAMLEEVRGEYLIILDADDVLLPHYASRCISELEAARRDDPNIGFAYTDCNLIDVDGKIIDRGRSTEFDVDLLETHSYIPEPAVCLTEAVLEAAPFDASIRVGTKHHKWKRMVAAGWVGTYVPEPLFCYRMHDRNLSGIGARVTSEIKRGQQGERILSGYWSAVSA